MHVGYILQNELSPYLNDVLASSIAVISHLYLFLSTLPQLTQLVVQQRTIVTPVCVHAYIICAHAPLTINVICRAISTGCNDNRLYSFGFFGVVVFFFSFVFFVFFFF